MTTARCDWRVVDTTGAPVLNLTASFAHVPESFWVAGHRTFTVADGRLFEMIGTASDSHTSTAYELPTINDSVQSIVSIDTTGPDPTFLLKSGANATPSWISVTARPMAQVTALTDLRRVLDRVPHHDIVGCKALDPAHHTAVFEISDSVQRSWFIVASRHGAPDALAPHVIGTVRLVPDHRPLAMMRSIAYRSERGDSLIAYVILPIGYVPGRRYPVIVQVYPGGTRAYLSDTLTREYSWAAYGYVELYPSQPFEEGANHPELPISQVTLGVLPAIDTIVRQGFADSARVGVLGHSFGAYAVYAMLTKTTRFRAAIARDGVANELSRWGLFMPYDRYSRDAAFEQAPYWYTESGQSNLPATPWRRPDLYIENSPFFAVDKITTPVLIEQGDQDMIPMAQGEQMFNALRRLGRRVDFVRYWGEGHLIDGYWNSRDWDQRERAWFACYLGGSMTPVSAASDVTARGRAGPPSQR